MTKKDIIIVHHVDKVTTTELTNAGREALDKLNLRVLNMRKYRSRIEARKQKIKRIY